MNSVLLLTVSYPFGGGEQFVAGEIEYLSSRGVSVVIFPASSRGVMRPTPGNITVLKKSKIQNWMLLVLGIAYSLVKYRKVYTADLLAAVKSEKLQILRVSRFVFILAYIARSCRFIAWFELIYKGHSRDFLNYSYWMNAESYGLSILKRSNPSLKTVCRVHGGDLYKERNHGFLPFREPIVRSLNRIFPISNQGKRYLTAEYGADLADKIIVSRLGVSRSDILDAAPRDEGVIIASCSSDEPVKRVKTIIEVIGEFSNSVSHKVTWLHIGIERNYFYKKYGPILNQYNNLNCVTKGIVPHEKVAEIYREYLPNIFINLSSSEGVPVSIMEAMSMGIPVVATDAGGTGEIVDGQVGALVSLNIETQQVIKEIKSILQLGRQYSRAAYQRWSELCNERVNYEIHYHHLREVQDG